MELRVSVLVQAIVAIGFLAHTPGHTDAARILGFFPSPSKSHLLIHCAVADALANAGHDVTVIAGFPNVYKHAKYNYIKADFAGFDAGFADEAVNKPKPLFKRITQLLLMMDKIANNSLSDPHTQKLLREGGPTSFDLVLLGYFMNDIHFGLAAHFNCPLVASFVVEPRGFLNELMRNPMEPAYVPVVLSGFKQPMGFLQRVKNFILSTLENLILNSVVNALAKNSYK